jgi:hypothetical protein
LEEVKKEEQTTIETLLAFRVLFKQLDFNRGDNDKSKKAFLYAQKGTERRK